MFKKKIVFDKPFTCLFDDRFFFYSDTFQLYKDMIKKKPKNEIKNLNQIRVTVKAKQMQKQSSSKEMKKVKEIKEEEIEREFAESTQM